MYSPTSILPELDSSVNRLTNSLQLTKSGRHWKMLPEALSDTSNLFPMGFRAKACVTSITVFLFFLFLLTLPSITGVTVVISVAFLKSSKYMLVAPSVIDQ